MPINDQPMTNDILMQFHRAWTMLRDAVEPWSAEQWASGDVDFLIPVRHAVHAAEAALFYACETPKDFPWGEATQGDWEGAPANELTSREDAPDLINRAEKAFEVWLKAQGDAGLLAAETAFKWTGPTKLARTLYVLRHVQHHVAVMNTELRRRGLPTAKWK